MGIFSGDVRFTEDAAIEHPFYRLAPEWALYPLVGLAMVLSPLM